MRQIEGDRNFVAYVNCESSCLTKADDIRPPLKSAPVFGGIAGIMAGERGDTEDVGRMYLKSLFTRKAVNRLEDLPTLDNKSREVDEQLRELYRRILAADWTCQPGEMSADKTIEEIFAGGDGWGNGVEVTEDDAIQDRSVPGEDSGFLSDGETRVLKSHKHRNWSGFFGRRHHKQRSVPTRLTKEEVLRVHDTDPVVRGRGSFEQQINDMVSDSESKRGKQTHELDEFDIREDLRCWNLPR